MRENKDQMSEMIIPSTPFLGLRERLDEQSQQIKNKRRRTKEKKGTGLKQFQLLLLHQRNLIINP
jgi:hypothetical protein